MSTSRTAVAQQHATRTAFFIPGLAVAAWAPIVPFAKNRTGLDEAGLGLVLLCLGAGSLLSMPLAGLLAARQGCRRVMLAAVLSICVTLPLLALAGSPGWLGVVLFLFGAGVGGMDCAMNLQAVVLEREAGKPMMSGFHAFYSIGGLAGAVLMTALFGAHIVPWAACLLVVAAILALVLLTCRHWRADRTARDAPAFAWPRGVVLLIGALCFVTFMAEGAMLDWSAVFLHEVRGAEVARSGLGFLVFSLAMTVTRLFGDGVTRRLGQTMTIVLGAGCAFVGFLFATLVPAWEMAIVGYALVGLGCANIVPALFSLAGRQKAMPGSLAIPAITTLGYAGVLAGPALIGLLAEATSLVVAFVCVAVAMLGVGLCMWVGKVEE